MTQPGRKRAWQAEKTPSGKIRKLKEQNQQLKPKNKNSERAGNWAEGRRISLSARSPPAEQGVGRRQKERFRPLQKDFFSHAKLKRFERQKIIAKRAQQMELGILAFRLFGRPEAQKLVHGKETGLRQKNACLGKRKHWHGYFANAVRLREAPRWIVQKAKRPNRVPFYSSRVRLGRRSVKNLNGAPLLPRIFPLPRRKV